MTYVPTSRSVKPRRLRPASCKNSVERDRFLASATRPYCPVRDRPTSEARGTERHCPKRQFDASTEFGAGSSRATYAALVQMHVINGDRWLHERCEFLRERLASDLSDDE